MFYADFHEKRTVLRSIPGLLHLAGLDESGKFSYGLFLISDISDLKKADEAVQQSELHYRTLIETMPNGVITISSDGFIRTANIHAAKMLGYLKIEDAIGKNLFDYIAPTDLEKCTGALKRATEKGFSKNTECTLISQDIPVSVWNSTYHP